LFKAAVGLRIRLLLFFVYYNSAQFIVKKEVSAAKLNNDARTLFHKINCRFLFRISFGNFAEQHQQAQKLT